MQKCVKSEKSNNVKRSLNKLLISFSITKIYLTRLPTLLFQFEKRKAIFNENLKVIAKHNAEEALGLHTFTLGVNRFTDMTHEEFVAAYLPLKKDFSEFNASGSAVIDTTGLPDEVDWRAEGFVTPVKDQGQCGSC